MEPPPGGVTILLARIKSGDQDALTGLIPLVYEERRRLAGHMLREERVEHSFEPTALVHEACLCLAGLDRANWQNRAQFMAIAARIMRRILLQYARRRGADKRVAPQPEKPGLHSGAGRWEGILAVDEALSRLGQLAPHPARIAEMRYFGGLSEDEASEALRVAPRTVKRGWAVAKGWSPAELGVGRE